jgi:hypothetical protein
MIFEIVTICRHPQAIFLVLLILIWIKETDSYRKLPKLLCLFLEPFCKINTSLASLFYQDSATEKNTIFLMTKQTLLKCLCSTFPVCLCSEKQLRVVLLEATPSTQQNTAFWLLEFCSCFFVVTKHQWHQIQFPSKGQSVLNCAVSFFRLADGCGLSSHHEVWVWKSLPPSCIRPMTKACLNSQGDNFKHTEVRMQTCLKLQVSGGG